MIKNEDKKLTALKWCSKFLGGVWSDIEVSQFIYKSINVRGALTNYIYTCELDESVISKKHECRKVLLRIYGEIVGSHEKFYELIIFNILSERKLGPRLLGAFKYGRIEEFIESKTLDVHQLRNGIYLKKIAWEMAKFHLLEAPFDKRPIYVPRFVSKYLPYFFKALQNTDIMTPEQRKIVLEMSTMNLVHEYETLLELLEKSDSPTVFCHNDVQEGNLLLLGAETHSSPNKIMLIDFEYSYYGYRGFDIGNHFCEWVLQNVSDKPLGFDFDPNCYPTHEQQIDFANAYLESISEKIQNDPESKYKPFFTTPEKLIAEANLHSLMSHLFWGFWGVAQHYLSHIDFSFL
ncbi:hypothetical protein MXB_1683, partial [Myxobolus squamalis]